MDNIEAENGSQTEGSAEQTEGSTEQAQDVDYSQSGGLSGRLVQLNCSVAISSYQSGFLYNLGCDPKGGITFTSGGNG